MEAGERREMDLEENDADDGDDGDDDKEDAGDDGDDEGGDAATAIEEEVEPGEALDEDAHADVDVEPRDEAELDGEVEEAPPAAVAGVIGAVAVGGGDPLLPPSPPDPALVIVIVNVDVDVGVVVPVAVSGEGDRRACW